MTIITVLIIPEGIILGSDSQTTINRTENDANGNKVSRPIKSFTNTQIIFNLTPEIEGINFCLSQFGSVFIGNKPTSTHIYSIREILKRKNADELENAEKVYDWVIDYFLTLDKNQVIGLNFYLTGFDRVDDISNPVLYKASFSLDGNGEIKNDKKLLSKPNQYGLNWSGEGTWIIQKLMTLSDSKLNIPVAQIPYNLLSLKDGTEFTEYLVNTVIGFEKFHAQFPTCGGKVNIGVQTPKEFKFLNKQDSDLFI